MSTVNNGDVYILQSVLQYRCLLKNVSSIRNGNCNYSSDVSYCIWRTIWRGLLKAMKYNGV
jgi:hypothetical protein